MSLLRRLHFGRLDEIGISPPTAYIDNYPYYYKYNSDLHTYPSSSYLEAAQYTTCYNSSVPANYIGSNARLYKVESSGILTLYVSTGWVMTNRTYSMNEYHSVAVGLSSVSSGTTWRSNGQSSGYDGWYAGAFDAGSLSPALTM